MVELRISLSLISEIRFISALFPYYLIIFYFHRKFLKHNNFNLENISAEYVIFGDNYQF